LGRVVPCSRGEVKLLVAPSRDPLN
jgi:hypothetical protein